MGFPDGCDTDKLLEVALGLMFLTVHGDDAAPRVWKGLDWGILDLLYQRGWITDPRGKAKSVMLTEEGDKLAQRFFEKHFQRGD